MAALTNRFADGDAGHLPSGMLRVGYDERTERYTFREGDDLWLGEPGSYYGGALKWAGKAPDGCSLSDDDEEYDDEEYEDYDTTYTESSSDSTSFKHPASSVANNNTVSTLQYVQELKNEWGNVPIASISDTDAKPPDAPTTTTLGRRGTQFKKVAKSTVTAISITRRWTRKKNFPRGAGEDQSRSSDHQRSDP